MRSFTTVEGTTIWKMEGKKRVKDIIMRDHALFFGDPTVDSTDEYYQKLLEKEMRRFLSMFPEWTWREVHELFNLLDPERRVMLAARFELKRQYDKD